MSRWSEIGCPEDDEDSAPELEQQDVKATSQSDEHELFVKDERAGRVDEHCDLTAQDDEANLSLSKILPPCVKMPKNSL